eukprot:9639586-Alexandrium_andersonii.AAC.1
MANDPEWSTKTRRGHPVESRDAHLGRAARGPSVTATPQAVENLESCREEKQNIDKALRTPG